MVTWFKNLRLAVKLVLAFIIVALLAGVVGVLGIININKISNNDRALYENQTLPLIEANEMATLFQRIRVNARDLILEDEPEKIRERYERVNTFINELKKNAEAFKATIVTAEVEAAFEEYEKAIEVFLADIEEYFDICIENRDEEAYKFVREDMQESSDAVREAIDTMLKLKVSNAESQANTNASISQKATFTMIIVVAVCMLVAITIGIFISNIISKPVAKVVEAAERIANSDLDVYVDVNTREEIGKLANTFNVMALNLNNLIHNINVAAEQVSAGSKQLSDSSVALSQGATEQASTIEELTSSLEEVASQTKFNADNSSKANSLAEIAKNNAIQGNMQMKEMLRAMEDINISSNNVSKIIKTIEEIAFQTNILALNAAIEAARAGQHGKGFAVVAEEVRNLAQRSSNAAKETTDMIESSIEKVNVGTKIANDTANALNEIVESVSMAADLVNQISSASNEQASAIAQINQAVEQVSKVVQTNSATAEESASASEELASQADVLKQLVSTFKLRKVESSSVISNKDNANEHVKTTDISSKKNNNNKTNNEHETPKQNDLTARSKVVIEDREFGKY